MEKKQKEESKFRQVWGNKRSRAMIQLSAYILFFILVGTFIDFNHANSSYLEEETQSMNNLSFSHYDNYEFYYNVTYLGLADEPVKYFNIDGYRYKEKQFLTVRDTLEKYYIENNKLYKVEDTLTEITTPFFLPFGNISPSFLHTYITHAKLNSKTEYADKTIKKDYILSVREFAKLYQSDVVELEGNISIITYEKDKTIYKVELDLTSYNKMKYELNYKNVGKVDFFSSQDILSLSHLNS